MTTDLERQFFDTFGIEPFIYCSKPRLDCDARNKSLCRKDCEYYSGILYPQISDRILLELVCICSQYGFCPTARNIKDLKLKVLKRFLELKKNLKNNYEHQGYHNAFARKVRTLFKECE